MLKAQSRIVCGDRINRLDRDGQAVCNNASCRFVLSRKGKMPDSAYSFFFDQHSRQIRERFEKQKRLQDNLLLAKQQEDRENQAYRQSIHEKTPDYCLNELPLLAVPRNKQKLTNLPERRKRTFRDKLNRLLSSVLENPNSIHCGQLQPDPLNPAARFLASACGLCAGACCLHGGNRAYLVELTIIRVMQAQPSLRPRDLLDLYLSNLGKKTYENSCVFHGEQGCVLPGHLRSNTCHDYYCAPLKQFLNTFDAVNQPEAVFVVVRDREHWTFPDGIEQGITAAYLLNGNGTCDKYNSDNGEFSPLVRHLP